MSESWYLSSTPFERYSGFELDDFTLYAIDGFGELLNYSPEAYTVLIENVSKRVIVHSIKDENDEKKILVNLNEISSGNIVVYKNSNWLTMTLSDDNKMYEQANIKRCNSSLKWKDSLGATKEAYFTLTKDTQSGQGISEGKVMIEPTEVRYITIQKNVDTLKIKKMQRFIFDSDRVWRVTSVNTLKTGIIELVLDEATDKNEQANDNVALRIADYYTTPTITPDPVGALYITSTATPNQIKINQTKVFQSFIDTTLTPVTWEVFDSTKTTTTNLVTLISSTSNSCTLKANSLSKYGDIYLKATLQSDVIKVFWLQISVKSIS